MADTRAPDPRGGFPAWVRARFLEPSAVYGLILYSALIAGVSDDTADAGEVLLVSAVSLVIFFAAHVFAHTLADHGDRGFWAAFRGGVRHSAGMVYAAVPSTVVLVLGAVDGLETDDAVGLALLAATIVLGVLGYSAYARRGAPVWLRIVGAVGTAILGFAIMLLNYAVH